MVTGFTPGAHAIRATRAAKLRSTDNAEAANELMQAPVLLNKIYRRVLFDPGNRQRCTESMAATMASVDEEAQKNVGFFMRFHFVQLIMHCAVRLYINDRDNNLLDIPGTTQRNKAGNSGGIRANGFDLGALTVNTGVPSSASQETAKQLLADLAGGDKDLQHSDTVMATAIARMHQMVLLPLKENRPRFFQRDVWRKNVLYVKDIDLVLSRYSSALKVSGEAEA